jgi:hypothetical protein
MPSSYFYRMYEQLRTTMRFIDFLALKFSPLNQATIRILSLASTEVYYSPFSSNVNEFRSFRRSLRELLGAAMARNDSIVEYMS